jgi:uncharacterized repeat protein (TIGR01451 family)
VAHRKLQLGLIFGTLLLLCLPSFARAADAGGRTGLLVTVAARECPTYQDVTANLARNNIMESLQDLGADTLYTSGEPINPIKEQEGQPNCRPITGWQFTLGSGIQEKASKGPWGALSIVTGAESPTVTTKASTPLLGWDGEPIKGQSLHGATTFELNRAQAERATRRSLWIQGGTTTDPVLFDVPGFEDKYGFAALRCSIDNLNGDNVETIDFPSGTTHAFCYAYYVTPPPSSGRIVIRKKVEGSGTTPQTFQFGGNVSYNPGGAFELSAAADSPGEITFFRGETGPGEAPWTVHEEVPDGWKLTGLHCESGKSQVTTDTSTASVSIALAPGDTVICTYVDTLKPPKGALLLRKVTRGGTGTFGFKVITAEGATAKTVHIKTTKEGVPAYARPLILNPGRYRILEHAPRDPKGIWRAVSASCNGGATGPPDEVEATVEASKGALCTFTNRLVYPGAIKIHKETIGGIGSAGFQITNPGYPTLERNQIAVVDKEKSPVLARGDSTRGLPFGTYVIQESVAQATDPAGWSLIEVVCDGKAVPFEQGRATVHLGKRAPHVKCRFVNLFTPAPPGPTPPGPTPTTPGSGPTPGEAVEIAVQKTLIRSGSGAVPTDVYRITVKNLSAATASNVVVTDQSGPGLVIVSAKPSAGGSCVRDVQYECGFESIPGFGEATVLVKAKDYGGGSSYNRAAVGSGTPDEDGADNVDAARAHSPERNFPACGSRIAVAHASC